MPSQPFAGVLVPVLTPFTPAGEPDAGRFVAFCRWLLDQGADGLAIFGTTSEANSMSAGERMALLDRLIAAGIPAAKLMPGTGACSMTEAATLIRHAVGAWLRRRLDAAAVLLQGHERRRASSHFIAGGHRPGRLGGAQDVPLPHPAADHARPFASIWSAG